MSGWVVIAGFACWLFIRFLRSFFNRVMRNAEESQS